MFSNTQRFLAMFSIILLALGINTGTGYASSSANKIMGIVLFGENYAYITNTGSNMRQVFTVNGNPASYRADNKDVHYVFDTSGKLVHSISRTEKGWLIDGETRDTFDGQPIDSLASLDDGRIITRTRQNDIVRIYIDDKFVTKWLVNDVKDKIIQRDEDGSVFFVDGWKRTRVLTDNIEFLNTSPTTSPADGKWVYEFQCQNGQLWVSVNTKKSSK